MGTPMKAVHYAQVGCAVLASAAMSYAAADPAHAHIAHGIAHAATSLLMALGLVSGSAVSPSTTTTTNTVISSSVVPEPPKAA
jgi:hypothetical protein